MSLFNSDNKYSYNYSLNSSKSYIGTVILCVLLILGFIIQIFDLIPQKFIVLSTQDIINFNITAAFTSLFFHNSIPHFLINLIALYYFGRKAEERIKSISVIVIFILGGAFANCMAAIYAEFISAHYLALGASAGIAPLLFAAIITHPFTLLTPIAYAIILYDIFNLNNENTTVNHEVHLIGYLTSFLIVLIFTFRNKKMIYLSILMHAIILAALYFILQNYT